VRTPGRTAKRMNTGIEKKLERSAAPSGSIAAAVPRRPITAVCPLLANRSLAGRSILRFRAAIIVADPVECQRIAGVMESSAWFETVDRYAFAEEAIIGLAHSPADLLLVNIPPAGSGRLPSLRRLFLKVPAPIRILLTEAWDPSVIVEAVAIGAVGCLTRPFTLHALVATIAFGMCRPCLAASMDQPTREDGRNSARMSARYITAREALLMRPMADGLLYKEIAKSLGVSYSAVHAMQHKVYLKLGARNRAEAVRNWQAVGRELRQADPKSSILYAMRSIFLKIDY